VSSDFGGGCEHGETPYQTALREGGEELTFFLGDSNTSNISFEKMAGFFRLSMTPIIFIVFTSSMTPNYQYTITTIINISGNT
jgi:8-oxo-dGTP pyrophosphatase MutT (NUDIX family)